MKYDFCTQTKKTTRVRTLFMTAVMLGCAFGSLTAQNAIFPTTVPGLTPKGAIPFLEGHAFGSQGYTCLPSITGGTSWTVNSPRPEATLFVNSLKPLQIITHFLSIDANPIDPTMPVPLSGNATWQSSLDSSKVWAVAIRQIQAGGDQSCPNRGSIPCLLLQAVGSQEGPTGGKLLASTTFVQRLNTNGGAAPTTTCSVGDTQLVPYTADYVFFRAEE